jgi:hypothetical protein
LAAKLFGDCRRPAHIRHDECCPDRFAIATADLSAQDAPSGVAAEISGKHVFGEVAQHRHAGGDRELVLDAQQRCDITIGEAAPGICRPGAHDALHRFSSKSRDECEIVGDALLLEVVEDWELRGFALNQAAAQVIELIVEKMKEGAAQKHIANPLRMPVAFDLKALAPAPSKPHCAVERMQHCERQINAGKRQAGGGEPITEATHDCFKVRARKSRRN